VTLNKLLTKYMDFVQQAGNSGPLESLPETHYLALEATNTNTFMAVEMPNAPTTSKLGDGEPNCRLPSPRRLMVSKKKGSNLMHFGLRTLYWSIILKGVAISKLPRTLFQQDTVDLSFSIVFFSIQV
jgi:hypothetical protein